MIRLSESLQHGAFCPFCSLSMRSIGSLFGLSNKTQARLTPRFEFSYDIHREGCMYVL